MELLDWAELCHNNPEVSRSYEGRVRLLFEEMNLRYGVLLQSNVEPEDDKHPRKSDVRPSRLDATIDVCALEAVAEKAKVRPLIAMISVPVKEEKRLPR